jgi:arabinogalactan endo-1,4-beta-galactosidase
MRIAPAVLLLFLGAAGARAQSSQYAVGADVSFVKAAEDSGKVFKDNGQAKPAVEILKDHGYNWVRLRVFRTPKELPNNLQYTIALAQAARAFGFHVLLDFHYSDTWADPGKQFIPAAWQAMAHAQLVQAVYEYTRDTIASMRTAGVLPDMVQVGNEITNGMLWPDGKLPDNWDHFAELIQAGIAGVRVGSGDQPMPRIMIHIDRGGDVIRTKQFFDKLDSYHVVYDVIGQSYYPWWQGSLNDLRENLGLMAREYKKQIIVVETAYSWTPANYTKKPGPFPETPDGQAQFLDELNRVVQETPGGLGAGVFWWEPAVMGGPLESRGFFDANGNALPAIRVFDKFALH